MATDHGSNPRAAVVISLAVLLIAAACGGAVTSAPSAPPSATAASRTQPVPSADGAIGSGTYRVPASAWTAADFTVTLPTDWNVQYGHMFFKPMGDSDGVGFFPAVVDDIWTEACAGSGSGAVQVGPSVDDLVTALDGQAGSVTGRPEATTLGGYQGTRIEMTVPEGFDLHPCNVQDIGMQIWYSRPADANFVLFPDAPASVYVLDVDGQRQVFVATVPAAASAGDKAELQGVLDSIRIEP